MDGEHREEPEVQDGTAEPASGLGASASYTRPEPVYAQPLNPPAPRSAQSATQGGAGGSLAHKTTKAPKAAAIKQRGAQAGATNDDAASSGVTAPTPTASTGSGSLWNRVDRQMTALVQ